MATSYIANLKVPTSATFTNGGYFNLQQTNSGAGIGITGVDAILGYIRDNIYEFLYGGSMTWVKTTAAGFDNYIITLTGLTTDPDTDATNGYGIVAFAVIDDGNTYYSASWLSTTDCEANGLCPPSVNPEDATGYSIDDINIRNAQDAFHGTADSYADFAENMAEECGDIPKDMQAAYRDWEASWNCNLRYDYMTATDENGDYRDWETDRKSTRLNSSHITRSRMPSSA